MVQVPGQEGPRSTGAEQNSNLPPSQDTAVIESPPPGQQVSVQVGEASHLQLRFDPTDVQIAQVDSDLLLKFPNGGQVALRDFSGEEGKAPEVILPDGTSLDGAAIIEQLEELGSLPPLETAGNGQGGPASGGGSSYQSDLGSIIDGLQSTGVAGRLDPESNVSIPGGIPERTTDDSSGDSDEEILTTIDDPTTEPVDLEAIFVPPENPVGPGADTALFTRKADNVDLNDIDVGGYLEGTQYDADNGNDTVVLPENARQALEAGFTVGTLFDAGRGNDLVTGGGLADLVDGAQGHDTVIGGAGDDSLDGGAGHDSLLGGEDNDLLDGGRNNDILLGGSGDDSLAGDHGRDRLEGEEGRDLLLGGGGNDSLLGGEDNDQLFGEAGRDTLDGGRDADLLDGGSGNDLLFGGQGDDSLDGGAGRDTLDGGLGDDIMTGGDGRDTFSFSIAENQGDDLILDFDSGKSGDRLELTDVLDVNGDHKVRIDDLDVGGHTVSGTVDAIVITFEQGGSLTLSGLDGSGVDSFADLLDMKVNVDIS